MKIIVVARHEMQCMELKEAFKSECIETAGAVFSCAGRGRHRKTDGAKRGQTAERAVTGFSKIRNEALAKALNYMRLMEEWGSGLKRVNDVFGEYGEAPEPGRRERAYVMTV